MKKNVCLLGAIFLFVLLSLSSSVFAQNTPDNAFELGIERLGEIALNLPQFFSDVLSSIYNNTLSLIELNKATMFRIFMSILLILIIYSLIDMADLIGTKNSWVKLLLSIGIGGLAIIALPKEFLDFLMPSYESLFSTLFSFVPFALILYFSVKIKSITLGRLLWLIVTIFFIFLFITEGIPAFQNGKYAQGMIFAILAILGALLVVFLRSVRSWFFKGEVEEITQEMEGMADIESAFMKGAKKRAETLTRIIHGR